MVNIEFRAKNLISGEWVYGYYLYVKEKDEHYILTGKIKSYPVDLVHPYLLTQGFEGVLVDGSTVSRCTNLWACGEKVFEGDILRILTSVENKNRDPYDINSTEPWSVTREDYAIVDCEFKTGGFRLKVYHNGKYKRIAKFDAGHLSVYNAEIVGNIWENKELLGVK